MKDFLGKELNVGDTVVYLQHWKTSSNLYRGVVTGFTPMKVRMDTCKETGERIWSELKYPKHIIKVEW